MKATGSGRPCWRATLSATANSPEESRPPEKLTKHVCRDSSSARICSRRALGVGPEGGKRSRWRGGAPLTNPNSTSRSLIVYGTANSPDLPCASIIAGSGERLLCPLGVRTGATRVRPGRP